VSQSLVEYSIYCNEIIKNSSLIQRNTCLGIIKRKTSNAALAGVLACY
jgi:hypothetical protein